MALIVKKRRMDMECEESVGTKHRYKEHDTQTIDLPCTSIDKLRVTFPNMEDRVEHEQP